MYNLEKVAEYFRAIQERNQYTQHELAIATGVAQSSINKIVNGQRVRLDTVERAADGLGIERDHHFYEQIGILKPIKTHDKNGNLTPEYIDQLILEGLHRLSSTNKAKVLRYINELDK